MIFGYELITVYCSSWIYKKSIAVQAVCRQDVNKILGTSWILLCKRQLRYLGKNDLECKYFHISNCILTMKGCTVKKIILRCFFTTDLLCLHEKFQVSQSNPSRFWFKKCNFLSFLWSKYFSCKIFTVLHQSKKNDQIWIKIEQKLGIYFEKLGNPLFQWIAP